MVLTRRRFLQSTVGAGTGTALGSLLGLGENMAPAFATAQELWIRDAIGRPGIWSARWIAWSSR